MMEEAKAEAVRRIREAGDRSMNPLIIFKVAQEYGYDHHELAREMGRRPKKERAKTMGTKVLFDMTRIEQLAGDRLLDLTKLADECGLSHDTLRKFKRIPDQPARYTTAQKVAQFLGVTVDEITRTGQMNIEDLTYQIYTKDEERKLNALGYINGMSVDEVVRNIVKEYLETINIDGLKLGGRA